MKTLTAILLALFAIGALASSETRSFFFDGSQSDVQMSLRSEETHTEYRWEQIRTICYRQEVYYRTQCRNTPQGRVCQTVPYYRTISYTCIQTVQVPYEVKDYDVEATVDLKVTNTTALPAGENFKVTLDEDRLSLAATSTGKRFFIILKDQRISSSINGTLKLIDASYTAELVEASPIVKALDVTNISIKDSLLSFKMGPVSVRSAIGFRLTVKKAPVLGSDTVLFDRELAKSEIQLSTAEQSSAANVDIEKLGVELSSGRHTLTATAFFKYVGTIINSSDFERTEASRTLIYKIR